MRPGLTYIGPPRNALAFRLVFYLPLRNSLTGSPALFHTPFLMSTTVDICLLERYMSQTGRNGALPSKNRIDTRLLSAGMTYEERLLRRCAPAQKLPCRELPQKLMQLPVAYAFMESHALSWPKNRTRRSASLQKTNNRTKFLPFTIIGPQYAGSRNDTHRAHRQAVSEADVWTRSEHGPRCFSIGGATTGTQTRARLAGMPMR